MQFKNSNRPIFLVNIDKVSEKKKTLFALQSDDRQPDGLKQIFYASLNKTTCITTKPDKMYKAHFK